MEHRAFREDPQLLALAREMRSEQTPAEKKLWQVLRSRRLGGFKFRRQVPIDRYIADFLCVECHLILELDGPSHHVDGAAEGDEERTLMLKSLGYDVLRLKNCWIHENHDGVKKYIVEECQKRRPPIHDA